MSDIDKIALRRLDITLLLVFLGLMRHRKVKTVAEEMGLTQSAVSHSIRRLRDAFGDELFLRRPHGMAPTAEAFRLEPAIRVVIETLDTSLKPPKPFDPAKANRLFRLTAYDGDVALILPKLLARLAKTAPLVRLSVQGLGRKAALAALDEAQADLALGFVWDLPKDVLSEPLFEQGYAVVARAQHPLLKDGCTMNRYLRCQHIVVSPSGDLTGIADKALAEMGKTRNVVAALPQFLPALATIQTSDLVATLPERLAQTRAPNLVCFPPPFAIRPFTVSAYRHRRNAKDQGLDWLVGEIRAVTT